MEEINNICKFTLDANRNQNNGLFCNCSEDNMQLQ